MSKQTRIIQVDRIISGQYVLLNYYKIFIALS